MRAFCHRMNVSRSAIFAPALATPGSGTWSRAGGQLAKMHATGIAAMPDAQVSSLVRRSEVLPERPAMSQAFVKKRVLIPVHALVVVQRDAVHSEKTLRPAVEHSLQEKLLSQRDDPDLQHAIYRLVSEALYDAFERSFGEREETQSIFETILKFTIGNKQSFHQTLTAEVKGSRALAQIKGGAYVVSNQSFLKGESVTFQLDVNVEIISFERSALISCRVAPN